MTKPITRRQYVSRLHKGHCDIVAPRFQRTTMAQDIAMRRAERIRDQRAARIEGATMLVEKWIAVIVFPLLVWLLILAV